MTTSFAPKSQRLPLRRCVTMLSWALAFAGFALSATTAHAEDQCERAGYPQCVARWARPSVTPRYSACWVGGGAACRGEPRALTEGTWGLDYRGFYPPRNVWLKWSHGRKYQGGTGSYRQDSPHVPVVPPLNKI